MSLWNDPKYKALAKLSAAVMGSTDGDIIAAILAQWTCEKGNADAYPPGRNNPGNLARGAASGLGYTFHVDYPNPQPGNPIVTFETPGNGAKAYGKLIAVGSRYAAVRAAVKAGNGHAYIVAMGHSGYGTTTACMLSTYHPPLPVPPTHPPGGEVIVPQSLGHVVTTTEARIYPVPNGTPIASTLAKGNVVRRFGKVEGWRYCELVLGGIPQYAWLRADESDDTAQTLTVVDGPV